MNFKYSRLASAIMLTVGVTACGGGGGSGNGDDPVISDYNVKLAVQDETGAPVPNITVCLDDNRDESCSVTDDLELTSTDSNGYANQTLTKDQITQGSNLMAVVNNQKTFINVTSAEMLSSVTKAESNNLSINVNPLTSQLYRYSKNQRLDIDAAKSSLANLIGINASAFDSTIRSGSAVSVFLQSLSNMNHNLGSDAVVQNVKGAITKIETALNKGVSVEGIISSYATHSNFDHLIDGVDTNHEPQITNVQAVEVACREVIFTAKATDQDGDTLSYKWELDDGTVEKKQSFQHVFSNIGEHQATLSVTDGLATVKEVKKFETTSSMCGADLKASFSISKIEQLTVELSNNSSGNIAKYMWDFGDGSTSTEKSPVHTYSEAGSYTISLVVEDEAGNQSEPATFSVKVSKDEPVVIPNIDITTNGLTVTLKTDAKDPVWDFTDGSTSEKISGAEVTKTFSKAGAYTVILYYTAGDSTASYPFTVTVESILVPTVSISDIESNGLVVLMKAKSSGISGDVTYEWNMGDGNTEKGQEIVHTYNEDGEYTIILKLLNSEGTTVATDTYTVVVMKDVVNHAPKADFTHQVADDKVTVSFTNNSKDDDGDKLSYVWDFGDGTTSTEENPIHKYPSEKKDYTVTLTASDGQLDGKVQNKVSIDVVINNAPVAVISSSQSGMQLSYDASGSTDADGDSLTYLWDFGDGTTSELEKGTHDYSQEGEYTIKLTVSDGKVNSETVFKKITVTSGNHAPVAKIKSSVDGLTLTYASESTDEDGDTLTYKWNFGDGSTSETESGTHTYAKEGTYIVTLTASDGKAESQPATKNVTVGATGDFEVDFTYDFNGLKGTLTAYSTVKVSKPQTYSWDLDDGKTATGKNPTVTYTQGGTKTVVLTVTSEGKSVSKSYTFELAEGTSVVPEKKGIYYKGVADGIYIWNDSGVLAGEWPGSAMTTASEDSSWSFYDTSAITESKVNVIFLKGGEKITGDLTNAPSAGCYDGKWTVIDSCVLSGSATKVSGGGKVDPEVDPDDSVLTNNIPWNDLSTAGFDSTAEGLSGVDSAPFIVPSLIPGSYHEDQVVTLTTEDADRNGTDATIYYTLDNTEPTTSSTKYTGPISLKDTSTDKLGTAYRLRALVVGSNGAKQEQHFFWFIKSQNPAVSASTDFRDETIYFVVTARYYDGDKDNNYYCRDRFDIDDPSWRGDFKGLIEQLDYIKSMGFTAIWITPPVENRSGLDYHGYHAYDWFQPDLRLESPGATYFDFIKAAHAKGIKVVQDVVLNHSSNYGIRGQVYLDKIPTKYHVDAKYGKDGINMGDVYVKNVGDYKSYNRCDNDNPVAPTWHRRVCAGDPDASAKFTVHFNDASVPVDGNADSEKPYANYYWSPGSGQQLYSYWYHSTYTNNWESVDEVQQRSMAGDCVDLTTETEQVQNYMNAMMRMYLDMGIDAVRIDTLKHMPREDVMAMTSKWQKYKPGLFVFGEALIKGFGDNTPSELHPWYYTRTSAAGAEKSGDSGISVLDFSLMSTFRNNVTKGGVNELANVFNSFDSWYADPTKLVTFFQNHDLTPDNTWSGSGAQHCCTDRANSALAYNVLWTVRGIPVMYAGDETGVRVGLPPDLTSADDLVKDTGRLYVGDTIDNGDPIISHITDLNAIRKASIALRRGTLKVLNGEPFVFERQYENDVAIVAIPGTGGGDVTVSGATDGTYQDLVTGTSYTVSGGTVNLGNIPGASMRVLVKGYTGGKVASKSQFLK